jgi:putative hemolysin
MKTDARAFFSKGNDPIYGIIANIFKTTGADRQSAAWAAVAEVAKSRLTGRQVTPFSSSAAAGETFLKDVFAYMTGLGDLSGIPDGVLASSLLQGVFEVPGRSIAATSVAGAYVAAPGNSSAHADPFWGAQPNPTWPAGDYLVYGYPFDLPSYFIATNPINGTYEGFELQTIPASVSEPWLSNTPVVGACIHSATQIPGLTNRFIHAGAILSNVPPSNLCSLSGRAASIMTPGQQFLASLGNAVRSAFVPKPAYAMFEDDWSGGGPTSWSPNIVGAVTASNVRLSFAVPPSDGNVGVPENIQVKVEYLGTDNVYHPIGGSGVTVTLTIAGNFGTPGCINPNTATADAGTGIANFNSSFCKAGGYRINATSSVGGIVLSDQFWIKNQ